MAFVKKVLSKKKLILSVVVLLIVSAKAYSFFFQQDDIDVNARQLELSVVRKGNLFETIEVLGKSKLIDEQKLRFNLTGRVTAVNFADGDSVKKGDIIAELDKSDIENDIKQAEISLQNAEMDLKKLIEGDSTLEIKRAENSLASTKTNLDLEKRSLDLSKKKLEEETVKIEQNLERSKDDLVTKTNQFNDAKTKLNNIGVFADENDENEDSYFLANESNLGINGVILSIDDVVNNLDYLFDEDLNYRYRSYLGVLDSNTVNVAKTSYGKSSKEKDRIKEKFEKIYNQKLTLTELDLFFNDLKGVLRLLVESSSDAYEVLEHSETGETFSQSELDSLKSTFSGLRSTSESKITEIEQFADKVIQEQEAVRLAKEALEVAKEDFEELQKSTPRLKDDAKIEYEKSINQYKELVKKISEDEDALVNLKKNEGESITRAENNVVLQKLVLEKTRKNISKYELSAPFDGLIRKIDFKVGDNLINEESKYAYLENPNILKITISLDQVDAVKVKTGQSAKIVFDALPNKEFVGKIEEINQSPKEENGVISYEATLTLEKNEERIFSGMTASVEIFVNEKKDVLLIPILAVQNDTVKKKLNGEFVDVPVEKGVDNGVDVEIISGLKEGDEVVVVDYDVLDKAMEINY